MISQSINSADFIIQIAGSDYEEVDTLLTFDERSWNRQCFSIMILSDSVFEGEENFNLTLESTDTTVTTIEATVSIQDDDGKSLSSVYYNSEG